MKWVVVIPELNPDENERLVQDDDRGPHVYGFFHRVSQAAEYLESDRADLATIEMLDPPNLGGDDFDARFWRTQPDGTIVSNDGAWECHLITPGI